MGFRELQLDKRGHSVFISSCTVSLMSLGMQTVIFVHQRKDRSGKIGVILLANQLRPSRQLVPQGTPQKAKHKDQSFHFLKELWCVFFICVRTLFIRFAKCDKNTKKPRS